MKALRSIITLAVIGGALYLTNPTMADFGAYYERKQVAAAQKNASGAFAKVAKALAQTGADLVVKLGFKRSDMLLFSVYSLGPADKPSQSYVGLAKLVFIKTK